jgi:DNA-binding LacI/PurR family transcriptional regulator
VGSVASSQPRATLQSVAAAAHVSRQTVSNALNAPHLVRAQTLERVLATVERMGYRPSQAARQLRTGRSRTVAVRLEPTRDGINGSVLDRFLHALADRGQADAYRLLLFTAADDDAEISAYDELLRTADLDGLVLTSTHHGDRRTAWLAQRRVPFVTFGRPWGAQDAGAHAWVDVDGAAGTAEAVRHLAGRGHRRIAFLGWPEGSGVGDDRRAGWAAGLVAAGLPGAPGEATDVRVPDGVDEGGAAMRRLLGLAEPPTAVVCASDSLALGALGALGALAQPADGGRPRVAVVGFDDTPVAAAVGLTSVAQPLVEAARGCMELLLAQMPDAPRPLRAHDGHAPTRLLSPRLVVRRTS